MVLRTNKGALGPEARERARVNDTELLQRRVLALEEHNTRLEKRLKGQEEVVAKLATCVEQVMVWEGLIG